MTKPNSDRPGGWRLGQVAGIPIHVAPSWLFIALILVILYEPVVQSRLPDRPQSQTYVIAAVFVILLFVSVLAHELGHALVAKHFKIPVSSMTLWMLGGFTEMRREPKTPGQEFAISAAGPLISGVLGGLGVVGVVVIPHDAELWREVVAQVAVSNVLITIFNLLPGLPLDGGALVRSGMWKLTGDRHRATIAAGWTGRVVAVGVMAASLAFALWSSESGRGFSATGLIFTALVCFFMWTAATAAIRSATFAQRLPRLAAAALARPAISVTAQVPLSEALRRGAEARASLVVVDALGEPAGLVNESAVRATPEQRRPWVTVADVARTLVPEARISADLVGESLLGALRRAPGQEYLVVRGNDVVGVLHASDISAVLNN
ncbi:MAG: site-2 protease family protein [Corynebacteriales bacterium]|nr:site-2 protease family protein [Mycobacteriales bacterium]